MGSQSSLSSSFECDNVNNCKLISKLIMTVVTKPIVAEKKDEKAFLEDFEGPANVTVTVPLDQTDSSSVESTSVILVRDVYQYSARSHYKRGVCRFPRNGFSKMFNNIPADGTIISGSFINHPNANNPERLQKDPDTDMEEIGVVEETKETITEEKIEDGVGDFLMEYEVNIEEDTTIIEKFPSISRGLYIHDFQVNKTMILEADSEDGRCFIMDLDRSEVSPPRTWLELIEKMNNGAYYLDLEEIRHDMVVVLPALSNVRGNTDEYGAIESYCKDRKTYKLQEESRILNKRSVSENNKFQFVEFSGKKFVKYNIVNLADI